MRSSNSPSPARPAPIAPAPLSPARLETLLAEFPRRSVGLLGDLFLDRYLELAPGAHEISLETGLEALQVARVRNAPGALGTVLSNLAALGAGRLAPVTVIGDDGHGYDLRRALRGLPVDTAHIHAAGDRLTPTYTKPLRPAPAGDWQELHRLDVRPRGPLDDADAARVVASLRRVWTETEGLIVLDQVSEPNWGVVDDRARQALFELAAAAPDKLVLIDSRAFLGAFTRGALKGNRRELAAAAALPPAALADTEALARGLAEFARRRGQAVYCTLGEEGLLAIDAAGGVEHAPGVRVTGPIDVVGAGDSATSALALALLSGATPGEAAALANLAASITIQQIGATGTASPAQLRAALAAAPSAGAAL